MEDPAAPKIDEDEICVYMGSCMLWCVCGCPQTARSQIAWIYIPGQRICKHNKILIHKFGAELTISFAALANNISLSLFACPTLLIFFFFLINLKGEYISC